MRIGRPRLAMSIVRPKARMGVSRHVGNNGACRIFPLSREERARSRPTTLHDSDNVRQVGSADQKLSTDLRLIWRRSTGALTIGPCSHLHRLHPPSTSSTLLTGRRPRRRDHASELLGPRFQRSSTTLRRRLGTDHDPSSVRKRPSGASPPSTYVSHFTAAELWGGVVPTVPEVHVSGPDQTHRCRRRGVKAHISDGRPRADPAPRPPYLHPGPDLPRPGWRRSHAGRPGRPRGQPGQGGPGYPEQLVASAKAHWTGEARSSLVVPPPSCGRESTLRWSPGCGC